MAAIDDAAGGKIILLTILLGVTLLSICNPEMLINLFDANIFHAPTDSTVSMPSSFLSSDFCSAPTSIFYWNRHTRNKWLIDRPSFKSRTTFYNILLIIGGIETNPGPRRPKFPCGICQRACKELSIACDECDQWLHKACIGMSTTEFSRLGKTTDSWICPSCDKQNTSTILYSLHESDLSIGNVSTDSSQRFSSVQSVSDISFSSRGSTSTDPADSTFNISDHNLLTSSPKCTSVKNGKTTKTKPIGRLRIINVNFQSLRKKGKLLEAVITDCDPDIIIGTETWLDKQILSSELLPHDLGYDIFRRDRPENPHGGVLIAAKRHLLLQNIYISDTVEFICGTLTVGNKKICIGAYYRPPNRTDTLYLKSSVEEMSTLKRKNKNSVLIISGDFNLPDINWDDLSIRSNQYPKSINDVFLDMLSDTNLEQVVDFPTRRDKTLDLILTSHPSYKLRCKPMPSIGNSDHDIVLLDTTISSPRLRPAKRQIFLWKKADISSIKTDIKNLSNSLLKKAYNDIESFWLDFKMGINEIIKNSVPTKLTSTKYTNPWMNTTIKRVIRRKQKAFKKSRKTGTKRDRDRYKKLQKEAQWQVRRASRQYMQDVVSEDLKGNPKRFWSYVKSKRQEATGVAPLKNQDGFLRSDSQAKANILNQQFSSVFTKEDQQHMPDMGQSKYPRMKNITVTRNGVVKLLKNLNCHKAAGPDEIPNKILQSAAEEIAPVLTSLFQLSIDLGQVPQDWREANVVPIFKKGEKHIAANYRPVSLTSVTCKLLEHIIHSNIMSHFDLHNILTDSQHGFRKRRSCETQLIVTIDTIAKQLTSKEDQVDVILLDFEKAFDKVPHSRLLYKLDHYGVRGPIKSWIQSFLYNRKQQVVLDGAKSSQDDVISGVPQGTVLGPLLFLAYINDMPEYTSSDVRLFADDSVLYRHIKTSQDNLTLQDDLDALERWERTWQMSFNASKCHVLHINRDRSKTRQFAYHLHGQALQPVDHSKYLGVTIQNNLTWDTHVKEVAAKGNRTLGFIKRNLRDCTPKVKAAGYTTLVRPVIEYASTVWDPHLQSHSHTLEQIQRRAARFVTNDYTSRTPGCMTAMLKRLGWDTLQQRRQEARLTMLFRIHHSLVDINRELYLQGDARTRTRFFQERTTNQLYASTFFPRTIVCWNRLPATVTAADSLGEFHQRLTATFP